MTLPHKISVCIAVAVATLLIAGILFGAGTSLKCYLKIDRNLREICIALWAFLGTAWFTLESQLFKPEKQEDEQKFHKGQRRGQAVVVFFGGVIAILIGATVNPT